MGKLEKLPATFGNLDALEILNLSNNKFKTFPTAIIPLKKIYSINITGNDIGIIPDEIANMKKGVVFYLYGLSGVTLEHLQYVCSITKGISFYTSYGFYYSSP